MRWNFAVMGLIKSRLDEGDFVSVVGPYSAGIVTCSDLRVGIQAVQATFKQIFLHGMIDVHWLDLNECIWRGIDCPDCHFEDLELA